MHLAHAKFILAGLTHASGKAGGELEEELEEGSPRRSRRISRISAAMAELSAALRQPDAPATASAAAPPATSRMHVSPEMTISVKGGGRGGGGLW